MKRINRTELAGLTITLILGILLLTAVLEYSFPVMKYAIISGQLVDVRGPVGQEVGDFLWKNRPIDLIAQAFVLFGAAAGCLAILRVEKKKEGDES